MPSLSNSPPRFHLSHHNHRNPDMRMDDRGPSKQFDFIHIGKLKGEMGQWVAYLNGMRFIPSD